MEQDVLLTVGVEPVDAANDRSLSLLEATIETNSSFQSMVCVAPTIRMSDELAGAPPTVGGDGWSCIHIPSYIPHKTGVRQPPCS